MAFKKLQTLIFSPEPSDILALKQLIFASGRFNIYKVNRCPHLTFNQLADESEALIDVVFVSDFRVGELTAGEFVRAAKGTKSGADSAYILLVKPENQSDSFVAERVANGFDGFLFEPFSLISLEEICELAIQIKVKRWKERQLKTLSFLMEGASRELDKSIDYLSHQRGSIRSARCLQDIAGVMRCLDEVSEEEYFSALFEAFSKASSPSTGKTVKTSTTVRFDVKSQKLVLDKSE